MSPAPVTRPARRATALAVLVLACGPLLAQQQAPGLPLPLPRPGATTPAAAATERAPAGRASDIVGILRLSDMGALEVLEMIENFTGKPIFRQQNIPAVRITFNSQTPLTREDAILALKSLLALNGIAVSEVGTRFLKAVPAASATNQAPDLLEVPANDLPPSQKIYTKFFALKFLSIAEAVPLLAPLLSQGAPIPYEKANLLLVTDAVVNLQRLERVLERIDRPAELDVHILSFALRHTTPTEVVRRLEALRGGSLKRFLENNTTFDADDRTSQLLVFTHPTNRTLVEDLIQRIDVNATPPTQTEIFQLKNADAEAVHALLQQVITGQIQARQGTTGSRTGIRRPGGEPAATAPAQPVAQPAQPAGAPTPAVRAGGALRSLQFSEQLTIVADPRSNAIVASGTTSDLAALEMLIEKIDVLLAQVRIEVVIAEVSLSDNDARGLDAFGISFNRAGNNDVGFNVSGPENFFTATGSLKDFNIETVFRTAQQNSNVRVLSTPTIVTTHNQEATITVGESRPVITATQSDLGTGSSLRSNVSFRDIGIELKVKPLIGSNGIIQMEINQKVENVVRTVLIDGNEQPIIGKREATSFLSIGDGEMVVLGGLQEINTTNSKGRIALFGQIPIIGGLFGSRKTEEVRRELVIFIRPQIIPNTEAAFLDALRRVDQSSSREGLEGYLRDNTIMPDGVEKR